MKKLLLGLLIISIGIFESKLIGQCTPPSSDECDDANVLCSLSEVNGYCCQNTNYSNPTGCSPLCPSGGGPHNTGWWAFVTQGGLVSITISFSNCSVNSQGIQMGIWGDCNCGESVVCNPACNGPGSYTVSGNLTACKTYYLFVDGCNGDVCDFCLTTSIGTAPKLPPLNSIVGPREICLKNFGIKYTVNVAGFCEPFYEWTLDGNEVGNGNSELSLFFRDSGNFVLCVTAYIGNPRSGSICDQQGPQCIPVKVLGNPRNGEKYYLGCDSSDVFIDPITRLKYNTCQIKRLINLPMATIPLRCDSSYVLNAVFLNYNAIFKEICDSGRMYISAIVIDRTLTCGNDSTLMRSIRYRWYLKSDNTKAALDTSTRLLVKRKDDYCMDVLIDAEFGDYKKKCIFTYCENIDESEFLPAKICPTGNFIVNLGDTTSVWADEEIKLEFTGQEWTVYGGEIITRMNGKDTNAIQVVWNNSSQLKQVCYQYFTNCVFSALCCQNVYIVSNMVENNLSPEHVQIVPNPIRHTFRLITKADLKIKSLQLFDLQGRPIQSWIQNFSEEFDLSAFTNGIYHVRIHSEQGTIHKKIVLIK